MANESQHNFILKNLPKIKIRDFFYWSCWSIIFTQEVGIAPQYSVLDSSMLFVCAIAHLRSTSPIRLQRQLASTSSSSQPWGPRGVPDVNYKFVRLEPCMTQSFGYDQNKNNSTPHEFSARQLLEKMATDPGVIAILKERELVVNTLGEMDPIDDRLMRKKEQEHGDGSCLLGYNTNHGLRIDIKLRSDDESRRFRPYPELVATLIHELSHNWVSDHNLLFWTNYGQMRAEYLYAHAQGRSTLVNGKTTAELAGLTLDDLQPQAVYRFVMQELQRDMAQHGLHPNAIAAPIQERCQQLERQRRSAIQKGNRLGGRNGQDHDPQQGTNSLVANAPNNNDNNKSLRERALEAAERRATAAARKASQNKEEGE